MTFAAITPAVISGAVADRLRFPAWAVFVPVWSLIVYVPVVYWIYGVDAETGELIGWLGARGSLDFAGGTAIHNLPLVLLGIGWFGWFGFNAGGTGGTGLGDGNGALGATALMNTFLAASAGMFAWLLVERIKDGHFTVLGACSSIVAGLVAITPAAAYVGGLAGIAFGAVAGFFADRDIVGGGPEEEGLFFGGGADLLVEQVISIVAVLAFSFVVTTVLARVIDAVLGLRADETDETTGLDRTERAELAYGDVLAT